MHRWSRACAFAAVLGFTATAPAALLWDNGPLATGAVSRNNGTAAGGPGIAAPAGNVWSELFTGNTSAGSTVSPSGATGIFRVADNFTLTQASTIDNVTAFAYSTGTTDAALFTTANIRIWDGAPNAGGNIIFGDTTTNRLIGSAATNMYRIFSTDNAVGGAGGIASPPGTTRRIKTAVMNIGGLNLAAGTYWVDYQIGIPTGGASVFHPFTTFTNTRGPAGANSIQLTTAPATWVAIVDAGDPATLADIAQDLAFQVNGNVVPEPGSLALLAVGAIVGLRRRRA